jgi:sugar-specific transcriptional regulator TrmB
MATEQPPEEQILRRLERRLDEASAAAERLIADAAATAQRRPPPAGWQAPADDPARPERDVELLAQVLDSLRELIPPELQQRVAEALREVLLALRALLDWYIERLERRRAEPVQVTDIPIS